MENVFKRFGAKGTSSDDRVFLQARLKLTLLYVGIFAVILFISGSVTRSVFTQKVHRRFSPVQEMILRRALQAREFPTVEDVRNDLSYTLLWVNIFLLALAGGAGYMLAGMTLEPIRANMQRQRQFLSDASHELRTPLTILQLGLERDVARASDKDEQTHLSAHLAEVGRMGRLLDDLLVLSRLDEGVVGESDTFVDVAKVVRDTIEHLQPLAEKHQVELIHALVDGPCFSKGSVDVFSRVLQNVIKNAIIHRNTPGEVRVSIEVQKHVVTCVIQDDGSGIRPEEQQKIFERFTRLDPSRSTKTGGSGLGLAIVRSSLVALRGSMAIESHVGKGTTISLQFPRFFP